MDILDFFFLNLILLIFMPLSLLVPFAFTYVVV